jgi:FkbM family methyltransferase
VATGVYIQRLDPPAYELYNITGHRISHIDSNSIITIGGCGFGGVLLTADIIKRVGHPQFEYHVALDHANTVSEDTDFCNKVRAVGGTIKCDTSLLYGHIGERIFMPQVTVDPVKQRLLDLHNQDLLPIEYQQYMRNMSQVIEPEVIYDLGSCVKHWTRHASAAWPDAELYCIDAMEEVRFLYNEEHFVSALLGCDDGRPVEFYQNLEHPGGNSVYKENPELSPRATELFPENSKVRKVMKTLDNIASSYGWKYPSLIKLDIQGSELETLKGAHVCLLHANDILIEMQHVDYNIGAPKVEEITTFLNNYGFHLVSRINGSHLGVDADYHFSRNPEKFHSN